MKDHPQIRSAELTGYPTYGQPIILYCQCCFNEIDGEVYEDSEHEYLCEECLRWLHKKKEW